MKHITRARYVLALLSLVFLATATPAIAGRDDSPVPALTGYDSVPLGLVDTPAAGFMAPARITLNKTTAISITTSGLTPSVVTITAGSDVVWQNTTLDPVRVKDGSPYAAYLPIVGKASGGASGLAPAVQDIQNPAIAQDVRISITVPPGSAYTPPPPSRAWNGMSHATSR